MPSSTPNRTHIIKALRTAKMPANTRKTAPSASAMAECARVVRDLAEAADWFHVDLEVLTGWLREKPALARAFRRAKLEDIREMRLIFREKAVAGSIQAAEKYLKMSYPMAFADKPQEVRVTTEVRVLPPPDKTPLIIEGVAEDAPDQ